MFSLRPCDLEHPTWQIRQEITRWRLSPPARRAAVCYPFVKNGLRPSNQGSEFDGPRHAPVISKPIHGARRTTEHGGNLLDVQHHPLLQAIGCGHFFRVHIASLYCKSEPVLIRSPTIIVDAYDNPGHTSAAGNLFGPAVTTLVIASGDKEMVADLMAWKRKRCQMIQESDIDDRDAELPPLLIPVREVARLTGLSERTIWSMSASRRMPAPLKLGSRSLWVRDQLVRWTQAGCPSTAPMKVGSD